MDVPTLTRLLSVFLPNESRGILVVLTARFYDKIVHFPGLVARRGCPNEAFGLVRDGVGRVYVGTVIARDVNRVRP